MRRTFMFNTSPGQRVFIEHLCTDPRCTRDMKCPAIAEEAAREREQQDQEVKRQMEFRLGWRARLRVLFTGQV